MKRTFLAVMIVFALYFIPSYAGAAPGDLPEFPGGNGTAGDPYIITTAAELDMVRNNMSAHYLLSNDIDLSNYLASGGAGYSKWGASGWEPIGNDNNPFSGNFDGNGHVISGLWIDRSDTGYVGLFGYTKSAEIANLGVKISSAGIIGENRVGGLVGSQLRGSVISCFATGDINGNDGVGGLVGYINYGNIENCYATGIVNGRNNIGGLAGYINNSNIENCYATGNVSGEGTVGGLVGFQQNLSSVINSYATGDISGDKRVGGLVGDQRYSSSIENSYATGDISGVANVGGLVGDQQYSSSIRNSYATGIVSGKERVGGLVGGSNNRTGTGSYRYLYLRINDAVIPPDSTLSEPDKRHGGVKTALELMSQTTYTNNDWSFYPSGPWYWDEEENFPKLNIGVEKFPFGFNSAMEAEISITAQPANILVTQGRIVGSLTVAADVIPSRTPTFQWYSNTTNNNVNGTLIEGETSAIFTIPTTLTAGTYYYFCEIEAVSADTVRTNVVSVTVLSDGGGITGDPYIITTAAELDMVRNNMSAHYLLSDDIDLSDYLAPGGAGYSKWGASGWEPMGNDNNPFSGNIDGNCHVISGLWINRSDTDYVGLFGYTKGAEIANLGVKITSAGIRGENKVGGLVGYSADGNIADCYAMGNVSGDGTVGGLMGYINNGNIENCYATGIVNGEQRVGGLVGEQWESNIKNCFAIGNVSGRERIGGLVGVLRSRDITNCYATGNVSGRDSVGGLVGEQHEGSIENCYTTGNVSGDKRVGGLVGEQWESNIKNCFAIGNVCGRERVGGLVGGSKNRTGTGSYRYLYLRINDAVIPPDDTLSEPDKRHGGVKTALELMSQTTYSNNGWSFYPSGPWHWDEEKNFPKLNIGVEKFPFGFNSAMEAEISITAQPANVLVTQGRIAGSLTVAADVIPSRTPTFHWYSNTTNNNVNGTLIEGETSAIFTIPTTLTAGTYYYFCEIKAVSAENVRTNVVSVSVLREGGGAAGDPYIITTAAELDMVRNNMSAHYMLSNDIDLSDYLAPGSAGHAIWGASGWEPVGNDNNPFSGNFDGNGHVISGLWINRSDTDYVGLFGNARDASIRNLGVEISSAGISGKEGVGGLVGKQYKSNIENSYATGVVGGVICGGLVGISRNSSVANCFASGDIVDYSRLGSSFSVGGLIGWQTESSIIKSYATGNVYLANFVGGLVGYSENCSIKNSYATGNNQGAYYTGGLVGLFDNGNIENCYASGNVCDSKIIGGLVGISNNGRITNSYATGNVDGSNFVGGLVGSLQNSSSITNCLATGNLSGIGVGGLVGYDISGSIISGSITNSYRYQFAMVKGAVRIENTPNNFHGGIMTMSQIMTKETYIDNGWQFYPSGPWHWDIRGFPKLNIGVESFPFKFTPKIATDPQNRTVAAGNIATYSVIAVGDEPLSYQWQRRNEGDTWSNIGTNSDTYSFTVQKVDNDVQFRVIVSNDYGSVISGVTILTVDTKLPFGNGSDGDPYIITTAAELDEVRNYLDAHYKLSNDIDLSDYLEPGGAGHAKWGASGWEPMGNDNNPFSGNFDGNGHIITGLWIYRNYRLISDPVGLFGCVNGAEIKNIGVETAYEGVSGDVRVGGLVGWQLNGSITNSYALGNVNGRGFIGGLVGSGGSIENCYAACNVNGSFNVGGLVGHGGSIKNSYATGNISGREGVGGLAGYINKGNIENSYATGNVSGREGVGGLVGSSSVSNIENCYVTGNVSGSESVGGLVGNSKNTSITNSYATGNLSGSESAGGLVGASENCSIINSYRYINLMVNDAIIPPDDTLSAPDKRHGGVKTALELMTQTTYTNNGWLFYPSGPWHWDEEKNFPKLNIGVEKFPFHERADFVK